MDICKGKHTEFACIWDSFTSFLTNKMVNNDWETGKKKNE